MNWPAYAEYKDSGIEWLGSIPSSWSVAAVKHTHTVTLGKMLCTEPSGPLDVRLPYLRAAHIPPSGFTLDDPKEMWFTPKEQRDLTLQRGDVVVVEGGMGGYGRCDIVPEDVPGWGFQNSINRLRPKGEANGAYTKYLLQMARQLGFIDVLCSISTMPHLTAEKLGAIRLPLPPRDEQDGIADFLDAETSKIDALVAKQEQLIATLREDRAATITQAVTKGLDPDVEMKDSGIGWLGNVPAHWRLIPLRFMYAKSKDQNHPDEQLLSIYRDYGVIPKDSRTDNFNKASADLSYYQLVESGDLVVNRMKAWQGSVGISRYRGIISPDYYVYKPLHDQFDGFLNHLFRCQRYAAGYGRLSTGVRPSQWSITPGDHLGMEALIPPVEEQVAIAEFLNMHCAKIDTLIDKSMTMIETLREYRSALITDAVTGNIDVRGVA